VHLAEKKQVKSTASENGSFVKVKQDSFTVFIILLIVLAIIGIAYKRKIE
jgi:hypothetical protein